MQCRVTHPSPQSSSRKRGEVENATTFWASNRSGKGHMGASDSPLPFSKGEDKGEGLFFCRSSSANQIAHNTLSSSWRT